MATVKTSDSFVSWSCPWHKEQNILQQSHALKCSYTPDNRLVKGTGWYGRDSSDVKYVCVSGWSYHTDVAAGIVTDIKFWQGSIWPATIIGKDNEVFVYFEHNMICNLRHHGGNSKTCQSLQSICNCTDRTSIIIYPGDVILSDESICYPIIIL